VLDSQVFSIHFQQIEKGILEKLNQGTTGSIIGGHNAEFFYQCRLSSEPISVGIGSAKH